MKIVKRLLILAATVIMLCVISVVVSAETYGDLTYSVSLGEVTITDCDNSVTTAYIPAKINGYPVRYIGESAFKDCTLLTTITIPDCVTVIGKNAFDGCNSLADITIPNGITKISYGMFKGCYSLKNIIIPDNVSAIDSYAFYGCASLQV